MLVGDPSLFAIESGITKAYERLSFRALGFFALHVGGESYGVREPEATLLACSFDAIGRRLAAQGKHLAPFAEQAEAGEVINAYMSAIFSDDQEDRYFGIPREHFQDLFGVEHQACQMAPDGDEAFDDESVVLQFDVNDRVRLIAFRFPGCDCLPDRIRDVWMQAGEFYGILLRWHSAFSAEWQSAPKSPEQP